MLKDQLKKCMPGQSTKDDFSSFCNPSSHSNSFSEIKKDDAPEIKSSDRPLVNQNYGYAEVATPYPIQNFYNMSNQTMSPYMFEMMKMASPELNII